MIPNANLWLRAADMRFGWADRDDGRGDQVPNSAQVPEDQGRLLQILKIQRRSFFFSVDINGHDVVRGRSK